MPGAAAADWIVMVWGLHVGLQGASPILGFVVVRNCSNQARPAVVRQRSGALYRVCRLILGV